MTAFLLVLHVEANTEIHILHCSVATFPLPSTVLRYISLAGRERPQGISRKPWQNCEGRRWTTSKKNSIYHHVTIVTCSELSSNANTIASMGSSLGPDGMEIIEPVCLFSQVK